MEKQRYIRIREYLKDIIRGSEYEGHVFVVGGCVRDEILGQEIKDIDLCVSLPGGGVSFAQWLQQKGLSHGDVAIYPSYGTAMLHLEEFPDVELEFVQTRKEKYIDHSCRNPITAFGTVEEDALRRDLTINSLSINISTGEIMDVTGFGVQDIRDHIIRTPVDPDITYDDDPLRILRCIRFASRYGWDIHPDTFAGMKRNAHRLEIICQERKQTELDKMLQCKHPVMAMELLRETGAMKYVFPEMEKTYDMQQNQYHFGTVWEHTMAVLSKIEKPSAELRMAALLHDIGKIATRTESDGKVQFICHETVGAKMAAQMLRRLKYSNAFIRRVESLVRMHMATKQWKDDLSAMKTKHLRKLQWTCYDEDIFHDLMVLIHADNMSHAEQFCLPSQVSRIISESEKLKADGSALFGYSLPLDGNDIMRIKGIKGGPAIKEVQQYLMKLAFIDPLRDIDQWKKLLAGYQIQGQ